MRIGKLAKESGVSVETVRFYEQKGLVEQPPRPAYGGFRDYPPDAVRRIRFIRSAQHLGFSLNEVAELLDLEAGNATQCLEIRERAEIKRREVGEKIEDLNMIKDALDDLIAACPGEGSARTCSILEAISGRALPSTRGETDG